MPLFDFQCVQCGAELELLLRRGELPGPCPECNGPLTKALSVPAGYRGLRTRAPGKTCCGRDERCDTPPCDGNTGCCSS
ncbi:MAG: FmdB family zinc ribbon protein [bacterium]